MYVMKYDENDPKDPANDLIIALIDAARRGVKVSVILENTISYNDKTLSFLLSHGVNATFDPRGVRTHSKLVIVDEYIVLIGSHNWTESALKYNHETSMLIISRSLAEEEIKYFNELWSASTE